MDEKYLIFSGTYPFPHVATMYGPVGMTDAQAVEMAKKTFPRIAHPVVQGELKERRRQQEIEDAIWAGVASWSRP